jgi:hypothetical protein
LSYEAAKNHDHDHALHGGPNGPNGRDALNQKVEEQEQEQPAQLQKYLEGE